MNIIGRVGIGPEVATEAELKLSHELRAAARELQKQHFQQKPLAEAGELDLLLAVGRCRICCTWPLAKGSLQPGRTPGFQRTWWTVLKLNDKNVSKTGHRNKE